MNVDEDDEMSTNIYVQSAKTTMSSVDTFKLFVFPIFWFWAHLMNVILERTFDIYVFILTKSNICLHIYERSCRVI